jgi:hypothetical protein
MAVTKRTKSRNENDHTKGALGKKTSRRTDKNQFWLGGRVFNTASPRLGSRTQRKASSQDGRPNATQGKVSWQEGHPNAMQGQLARWAPKRMKRRNGTHERP